MWRSTRHSHGLCATRILLSATVGLQHVTRQFLWYKIIHYVPASCFQVEYSATLKSWASGELGSQDQVTCEPFFALEFVTTRLISNIKVYRSRSLKESLLTDIFNVPVFMPIKLQVYTKNGLINLIPPRPLHSKRKISYLDFRIGSHGNNRDALGG